MKINLKMSNDKLEDVDDVVHNIADRQKRIGYGLEIAGGFIVTGSSAATLYAICTSGLIAFPSALVVGAIGLGTIFSGHNVVNQANNSVLSFEAKSIRTVDYNKVPSEKDDDDKQNLHKKNIPWNYVKSSEATRVH